MLSIEGYDSVISVIFTFCSFVGALLFVPALFISYLVSELCRLLWTTILEKRFPHLEFVDSNSIRTLADTHRNTGVINILLEIKGLCDQRLIKQKIKDNLVDKRDKNGRICFPRLRYLLTSCWGSYAWQRQIQFNIDNQVISGSTTFRARPISESNIQEYISNITSKYIPPEISPWQIVMIPNILSLEPKYYILIRLHHILLSKETKLQITDFLLFQNSEMNIQTKMSNTSPFLNVYKHPKSIPNLYQRIKVNLSNEWNEFVYNYDPLETPQKHNLGIFHVLAVFVIIFVTATREIFKINGHSVSFITSLTDECTRRQISIKTVVNSLFVTLNLKNLILSIIKYTWRFTILSMLKVPVLFYHELAAFQSCLFLGYCTHPNTVIALLYNNVPLIFGAVFEILHITKLLYNYPYVLVKQFCTHLEQHDLQTMGLSGRKVVAWSQKIPSQFIRNISKTTNVTDTEILLLALSATIRTYFVENNLKVPKEVATMCKNESQNDWHTKNNGSISLYLPIKNNMIQNMKELKRIVNKSRREQELLYYFTALQTKYEFVTCLFPSVWTRLIINYLSRKFSVIITEVVSGPSCKMVAWGHEVASIMYWRTPQSNISLSVTFQKHGENYQIAVMADAQLSPHHSHLAANWSQEIINIGKAAGISQDIVPSATITF